MKKKEVQSPHPNRAHQAGSNPEQSSNLLLQIQAKATEAARRKKVRRQVLGEFQKLDIQESEADRVRVISFLADHLDSLDLMREALAPYRRLPGDPRAAAVWEWLLLPDQEILARVEAYCASIETPVRAEEHVPDLPRSVTVTAEIDLCTPSAPSALPLVEEQTEETVDQSILQEALEENETRLDHTDFALDSFEVAPSWELQLGWDEKSEEGRKVQVLNLPPLVAYDLLTAKVDMNALQILLTIPRLAYLRGKRLEEFTEADILELSYRINHQIRYIKSTRRVAPRTLATLLLSVARLLFERLEIGTAEAELRFCLSAYSTRMGEYLIEQHNRYDIARDYYLGAVSLNLVSLRGFDFPTFLLFRSFFHGARVRYDTTADPSDCLVLFRRKQWQTPETFETAARSFLELSAHHFRWAIKWFRECPEVAQVEMLSRINKQLLVPEEADFTECTNAYVQAFSRFQALLRQMYHGSTSAHAIVQVSKEFEEQLTCWGFLVSPTNQEIATLLIQAGKAVAGFLQEDRYEHRRRYADTAITHLERVLAYEHDNSTALWAAYFRPIAQKWHSVISHETEAVAQGIAPEICLHLAEENVSLTDPKQDGGCLRVIVRVQNTGLGTADRVNIRFSASDGETFSPHLRDFTLEPGEGRETYFELHKSPSLQFDYTITYYDPDRLFCQHPSSNSLVLKPLIENPLLEQVNNPFEASAEVTDERMFVGRARKLQEVAHVAIHEGGLLMLHGQKRVGKSSFLGFLEKQLDRESVTRSLLPIRVSWLHYSKHYAWMVLFDIAQSIESKARSLFNISLPIPSAPEFERSCTFAFNAVLRALGDNRVSRLALMIDEFDVIVHGQLDHTEMGFDRSFFEYLRGLSKQEMVTLVLIGGEMMPMFFERMGVVFNHDRAWRIDYLSRTDGSVEQLVRNDYVRNVLVFSDEAIEAIKEASACNPFFVQMICRELVEAAKRQKSSHICELDVEEVVAWLIQRGGLEQRHVQHLYWPLVEPVPLEMAIIGVVAQLESKGHRPQFVRQQDVIGMIDPTHHDQAITELGELVRREVLRRDSSDSSRIRIMLPMFRDWFNNNKPEYKLWAPLLRR